MLLTFGLGHLNINSYVHLLDIDDHFHYNFHGKIGEWIEKSVQKALYDVEYDILIRKVGHVHNILEALIRVWKNEIMASRGGGERGEMRSITLIPCYK